MADIPGIIEGAHEGKGLGLRFLRHIERNSVLLFMIPADSPDVKKDYAILLNELEQYSPELLDKERMLAITKCDMLDEVMMQAVGEGATAQREACDDQQCGRYRLERIEGHAVEAIA
jgi:GTP-binding protein